MKLIDFIKVYNDIITPEICKKIINEYERHSSIAEEHDTEFFKFHQLNLTQTPELKSLGVAVAHSLIPIYEDYFNALGLRSFVKIDTFEDIRIKKYVKGSDDHFKTHVDVTERKSASRFCVSIIYLNDNNGLTTFPHHHVEVLPKAGRAVLFPPTWMFPHNGKSPTDNDKYIMMTCLHYKDDTPFV